MPYFQGSYADLEEVAQKEQLPYFVVFTLPHDGPSDTWRTTLDAPEVVNFVVGTFIPFEVSNTEPPTSNMLGIQDLGRGGIDLANNFGVMLYPTTILFRHDGRILKRFAGALSAEAFIKTLSAYVMSPMSEPVAAAMPDPTLVAKPAPTPRPTLPALAAPYTELPAEVGVAYLPIPQVVQRNGRAAFSFRAPRTQGFAVQAGAFTSYENVYHFAQALTSYHEPVVLLVTELPTGQHLYKVLIGTFDTLTAADAFLAQYNARAAHPGIVVRR